METKTKICSKCKKEKPLSEFHKDPRGKDGYRSTCKECRSYKERDDIKTKICSKCKKEKPLSEFHKDRYSKDGHNAKCKECRSIRKTPKPQTVTITIDGKEYQAKKCSRCNQTKPLEMFPRGAGLGGRHSWCKQCRSEYHMENRERDNERSRRYIQEHKERMNEVRRAWIENNKEYYQEIRRKWREKNRDKLRKYLRARYLANKERHRMLMTKWYKENWDRFQNMKRAVFHRRRTMETSLPNTLTADEIGEIKEHFGNACSLTGRTDDIHLDHFIPLAIGHGGTYKGNIVPLTREVNRSKSAKNPFEWIEDEETKKLVDLNRWEKLIEYLADQNGLTVDEFKDYVNWCFENPRKVEEIEEGVTSIELWKRSKD